MWTTLWTPSIFPQAIAEREMCMRFDLIFETDARINSPWTKSFLSEFAFFFFSEQSPALCKITIKPNIKSCWEMSVDSHNKIYLEPAVTCDTKNNQLRIVENVVLQLHWVETAAITKTRHPPACGRV